MKCSLPVDLLCVNMNLSVRCSWTEKWNFCHFWLRNISNNFFLFACQTFHLFVRPHFEYMSVLVSNYIYYKTLKKRQKHGVRTESPSYFHSDCLTLFSSRLGITLWWCTVCAHTRSWALTFRGGDLTKPGWTNTYYVTNWVISWHFHRDQGIYNNWCSQLLH